MHIQASGVNKKLHFSKLRQVIFLSESFRGPATTLRLSISPMIDQVNFSRENNTLNNTFHIWYRVHERNSELCLSFFGYSLYVNLLSCAIISAPTKPKVNISCSHNQQSTDQLTVCSSTIWSPSPFCRICKEGKRFQPRLQFSPLFFIVLSAPPSANLIQASFV